MEPPRPLSSRTQECYRTSSGDQFLVQPVKWGRSSGAGQVGLVKWIWSGGVGQAFSGNIGGPVDGF